MRRLHDILPAALFAATLIAQAPEADRPVDPVALVSTAEQLLKKGEKEDAILLLWQALDLLATLPGNPIREATILSARFLLDQNDNFEGERRRVFGAIARQQLELAQAYRSRKWFDTAATRLLVAESFDRDAAAKERALLTAAAPKAKETPAPVKAGEPAKPALAPLLQRRNTSLASGAWQEDGELLICQGHDGSASGHSEWVSKAEHADNELIVELRGVEAKKDYNVALTFGMHVAQDSNTLSYRAHLQYDAESNQFAIILWQIDGNQTQQLGSQWVPRLEPVDGFHRLSVRVSGARMRAQVDGGNPIEVEAKAHIRGQIGLLVGLLDLKCCPIQLRNLRIDPLPADQPSDEELRAQALATQQSAISTGVDTAKDLLAKKQPEAAATTLRRVLTELTDLPAGVLRNNLQKTIEAMLLQADPLTTKRKKTADAIAVDLLALADVYAVDGRARLALELVRAAADFDPPACAARLAVAEEAVAKWNLAQATARAGELAPPADDGTVLREWFATGKRLDSRLPEWTVDGPVARVDLESGSGSALMPKPGLPGLAKASVHVRLRADALAGFCFNVAGPHDYAVGVLDRDRQGLALRAFRYANGKWVALGRKPVAMDAWRRDAWFALTLEATPAGFTVKAMGAELVIDQKRLGPASGRLGLYASNGSKEPMTIELRAFQWSK